MSNANVAFVQSLYAAFGRSDIATIAAALMPDVHWHVSGRPQDFPGIGTWKGPQEVTQFFALVAEHEQFSEFLPQQFDAAGNKVFVQGRYAGTIRKTGRTFASEWMHVFTIADGKVSRFKEFTDTAQFAEGYRG